MARLTRRQFLGDCGAARPRPVRSPTSGSVRVGAVEGDLGSSPGATSSRLRQVARPVDGRSGSQERNVKADHRPHPAPATSRPRSRPRSPPSPATTSSSWSGTGTEKWADGAGATSRTWPTSSARSTAAGRRWPRTTPRSRDGIPPDPRLLHRLPGPLPQGPLDRGRHAERPGLLGRAAPVAASS